MRTVIIGHIVSAYREDADCPDFADALAEHLPHLSDAYLGNPVALTRHLLAQGYGEPLPASGFGRDAETIMRAIVAGPCRHYREFTRRQLAFDLRRDFERDPAEMVAQPCQQAQATARRHLVGGTDADYAKPSAMPGLISYRLRGPYGFIAIGALSNAEAMREAARSTPSPDRAALEVWCHDAEAFIGAAEDFSEGAPVTRAQFWRVYAATAARLYAAGTLYAPMRLTADIDRNDHRGLGVALARLARAAVEAGDGFDTTGPCLRDTLRAVGFKARARRDVLAFIGGLR